MAATLVKCRLSEYFAIVIVIIFCILFPTGYSARLNVPKVLLPYYSNVVANYTLEVTESLGPESCYTWKTSRPEVVTVQVLNSTDGECSLTAAVSAVSKSSHRMTAILSAENKVTGEVLRCYVIVDSVAQLQIETTTRELFLEDTPEDFYVMGFDDKGNVFDSLQGIVFEWALLSDTDTGDGGIIDAHNVLRIVPFGESNYQTPAHIDVLEGRGLQGDKILVDGIRTGTAWVSASFKDPAYKHVKTSSVRLVVRANLLISPPDAYVLKFSDVKYKVEMVKKNTIVSIPMPNPQYYLDVGDGKICILNVDTSTATGLELGSTEIILRDRNINDAKTQDSFSQPSAMLHVVNPSYLAFVVLPTRKWVLETGREYDVLMEVYDKDSHKLYSSDNVIIQPTFQDIYLEVTFSTKNGTFHHVRALKRGLTHVDGSLSSIKMSDGGIHPIIPVLRHSQDVEIYDPITVLPPVLYFSWSPVHISYQYQLKASGGSGDYVWSSSHTVISMVTIRGEINTGSIGSTTITAADVKNHAHTGSMQVHILPPQSMMFLPSPVEAEIGTVLQLPLAIYSQHAGKKIAMTDCHLLAFNITFSDTTVFTDHSVGVPIKEGSCATLKVTASQLGSTEVMMVHGNWTNRLQTTATIAAYKPLQPVDPEKVAVVAVGSSKEVLFEGGPLPWVLDPSKYFQNMSPEKQELVSLEQVNTYGVERSFHIFYVLCRDLGEQKLTLVVGNEKTTKNEFPAKTTSSIQFACVPPVSLQVSPELRALSINLPPCPISQDPNQPIPVHCEKGANVLVSVFDSKGRKFDNFSSLAVDWTVSDTSLASLDTPPDVYMDTAVLESGAKKVTAYQKLDVFGKTGRVILTASISKYETRYITSHGIRFDSALKSKISKSVELMLVKEPTISPDQISVFNHPSNKVSLEIKDGSGYFHVEERKFEAASIQYLQRKKKVEVVPLQDGALVVMAFDLCLDLEDHPKATIHVSGVGSIKLNVVDKIEISKEVVAYVEVLDSRGSPLSASFFTLMNLQPVPGSDFITVRDEADQSNNPFSTTDIVYGAKVGHTTLTYQVQLKSGQIISSEPKQIEVFPPLRLSPRNITVIIGAEFQVYATGGPSPSSSIEFYVTNGETAQVSAGGLLQALEIGNSRVIGKAVGHDPITGEPIVYSQDQVEVHVVMLTGIKIHAPLARIKKNAEMPLYAVGVTEHETPLTFGSVVPPLHFSWSVTNKDVAQLRSVFHESGIALSDQNNFASHLLATAPGHVTVKLRVRSTARNQIMGNTDLKDEVQIKVFDRLSIVNPAVCDGQVLITPDTTIRLKTNRDGAARLAYSVTHQSPPNLNLKVDSSGNLVSNSVTGQATLLVTAQEDFEQNQTSTLLVKVERVAYLMLNADTVFKSSNSRLGSVPVGSTVHFTVTYHDQVGSLFHATNNRINYRSNRFDHLQVTSGMGNNTLLARATDIGDTIVKVWSQQEPRMVDYINVPVDTAILPSGGSFTVGDVICFSSPLVSEWGHEGSWSTVGKSLMVDGKTGIAVATGVGSSTVKYSVSEGISTHIETNISPIKQIFVGSSFNYLTNYKQAVMRYHVVVGLDKEDNLIGDNCNKLVSKESYPVISPPFHCVLQMSTVLPDVNIVDLFKSTAMFDPDSGHYSCEIERVINDYIAQPVSRINTDIILKVHVPSQNRQPEVISPELRFDFYPAFYVHNREVHISNLSPSSSVRVSMADKLVDQMRIQTNETDVVELLTPERDTNAGSVLVFPIRLLETEAAWQRTQTGITVELICQSTGQVEKVTVMIKLLGEQPEYVRRRVGWLTAFGVLGMDYKASIVLFLCGVGTFALFVTLYFGIFGPRYTVTSAPGTFSQPGSPRPPGSPYEGSSYNNQTHISPYKQDGYSPPGSPFSPVGTPYRLWSTGYRPQETSPARYRKSPHSPSGL